MSARAITSSGVKLGLMWMCYIMEKQACGTEHAVLASACHAWKDGVFCGMKKEDGTTNGNRGPQNAGKKIHLNIRFYSFNVNVFFCVSLNTLRTSATANAPPN